MYGGIVEQGADPPEEISEDDRQAAELLIVGKGEIVLVISGQDPGLVGRCGGEGGDGQESAGVETDAFTEAELLPDHVAEETPLAMAKVVATGIELLDDCGRDDRRCNQLGVGMGHRSAGFGPLVFEDQRIAQALVSSEV